MFSIVNAAFYSYSIPSSSFCLLVASKRVHTTPGIFFMWLPSIATILYANFLNSSIVPAPVHGMLSSCPCAQYRASARCPHDVAIKINSSSLSHDALVFFWVWNAALQEILPYNTFISHHYKYRMRFVGISKITCLYRHPGESHWYTAFRPPEAFLFELQCSC